MGTSLIKLTSNGELYFNRASSESNLMQMYVHFLFTHSDLNNHFIDIDDSLCDGWLEMYRIFEIERAFRYSYKTVSARVQVPKFIFNITLFVAILLKIGERTHACVVASIHDGCFQCEAATTHREFIFIPSHCSTHTHT